MSKEVMFKILYNEAMNVLVNRQKIGQQQIYF